MNVLRWTNIYGCRGMLKTICRLFRSSYLPKGLNYFLALSIFRDFTQKLIIFCAFYNAVQDSLLINLLCNLRRYIRLSIVSFSLVKTLAFLFHFNLSFNLKPVFFCFSSFFLHARKWLFFHQIFVVTKKITGFANYLIIIMSTLLTGV